MAHLRPYSKQLTCPDCGDVIGEARLRPLTGWLTITRPGGGLFGASEGGGRRSLGRPAGHGPSRGGPGPPLNRVNR